MRVSCCSACLAWHQLTQPNSAHSSWHKETVLVSWLFEILPHKKVWAWNDTSFAWNLACRWPVLVLTASSTRKKQAVWKRNKVFTDTFVVPKQLHFFGRLLLKVSKKFSYSLHTGCCLRQWQMPAIFGSPKKQSMACLFFFVSCVLVVLSFISLVKVFFCKERGKWKKSRIFV